MAKTEDRSKRTALIAGGATALAVGAVAVGLYFLEKAKAAPGTSLAVSTRPSQLPADVPSSQRVDVIGVLTMNGAPVAQGGIRMTITVTSPTGKVLTGSQTTTDSLGGFTKSMPILPETGTHSVVVSFPGGPAKVGGVDTQVPPTTGSASVELVCPTGKFVDQTTKRCSAAKSILYVGLEQNGRMPGVEVPFFGEYCFSPDGDPNACGTTSKPDPATVKVCIGGTNICTEVAVKRVEGTSEAPAAITRAKKLGLPGFGIYVFEGMIKPPLESPRSYQVSAAYAGGTTAPPGQSAPVTLVTQCPANSTWNDANKRCECNPGWQWNSQLGTCVKKVSTTCAAAGGVCQSTTCASGACVSATDCAAPQCCCTGGGGQTCASQGGVCMASGSCTGLCVQGSSDCSQCCCVGSAAASASRNPESQRGIILPLGVALRLLASR